MTPTITLTPTPAADGDGDPDGDRADPEPDRPGGNGRNPRGKPPMSAGLEPLEPVGPRYLLSKFQVRPVLEASFVGGGGTQEQLADLSPRLVRPRAGQAHLRSLHQCPQRPDR